MKKLLQETCRLLMEADYITILTHQKPDGDTLGAAFALLGGLESIGKTARVLCSDGFPPRYHIITGDYQPAVFEERFVVAVDIADLQLLGSLRADYEGRIDLCIDHHPSNTKFARHLLLRPEAASTCELLYEVLLAMKVTITPAIANCIYTGIATDTGCFRFSNTTRDSHRVAADLIDAGADYFPINRIMFECNSKGRILVECRAKGSLEYYYDGYCAIMYVTPAMLEGTGVSDFELEGFANIPRAIEGVEVGITIREKATGECRISMRSSEKINVSEVCAMLGGGGHQRAAGCTIMGDRDHARDCLLDALAPCFPDATR